MQYIVNTRLQETKRFIIFPLLGLFTKLAKFNLNKNSKADKHYMTVVRMPGIDRF